MPPLGHCFSPGLPPVWLWCPLLCWVGQSWGREGSSAAGHKPRGDVAEGQIFLKARELSGSCAACKEEKLRGVLRGVPVELGAPRNGRWAGEEAAPSSGAARQGLG